MGFVAITLTRKANEADKKGLGEMYCRDIMLSVTQQLVGGMSNLSWTGLKEGQTCDLWSGQRQQLKTQFHNRSRWNIANAGPIQPHRLVQQTDSLTSSRTQHSQTAGWTLFEVAHCEGSALTRPVLLVFMMKSQVCLRAKELSA